MTDRSLTQVETRIVEALKNGAPMKYADLRRLSCGSNRAIKALVDDGILERLPMGLYTVYDPERVLDTSFESFAALAVGRPDSVICLESAAAYHGLTVDNPSEIWAAFPYKSSAPRGSWRMEIRASRWNDKSMTVGVEEIEVSGVKVRITGQARTVVDFHRFAKKRGGEETAGDVFASYAQKGGRMADVVRIAKEMGCEESIRLRLAMVQSMGRHR